MANRRLKPKAAAKYLGCKLQTLYNNASKIPHTKHGYLKSDLDIYLNTK